jgi:hypothetical protein
MPLEDTSQSASPRIARLIIHTVSSFQATGVPFTTCDNDRHSREQETPSFTTEIHAANMHVAYLTIISTSSWLDLHLFISSSLHLFISSSLHA